MNLCLVHRDRRALLAAIEPEFEKLRGAGVEVLTFNTDALAAERRTAVLDELAEALGDGPRARAAPLDRLRQPEAADPGAAARAAAPEPSSREARRRRRRTRAGCARRALRRRESTHATRSRARPSTPTSTSSTRRTSRERSTPWARACWAGCRTSSSGASSRDGRARLRPDQRGQRGRVEGLRRGGRGEGGARVPGALDRRRVRALRRALQRHPGRASPRRRPWRRFRAART